MRSLLIASQEARNFENLASHADFLRGSSRVPAPLKSVGQESVTTPKNGCAGGYAMNVQDLIQFHQSTCILLYSTIEHHYSR